MKGLLRGGPVEQFLQLVGRAVEEGGRLPVALYQTLDGVRLRFGRGCRFLFDGRGHVEERRGCGAVAAAAAGGGGGAGQGGAVIVSVIERSSGGRGFG